MTAVLKPQELARRPSRPADFESESAALQELARELVARPENILQKLVEIALTLCGADSAGVSILEPASEPPVFRWHAMAGRLAGCVGGTMPGAASPCGAVIDQDATLVFVDPAGDYPYAASVDPPIVEALLVPFHAGGVPVGTAWAIAHTHGRPFDAEDARLLGSLSRFAAAGYQMTAALAAEASARRQIEQRTEQLRALTGELTLVEARERARLAQVLHDHLEQSLVGARLRVSVVREDGPPGVQESAAAVEQLLDECLVTARVLTAELSPQVLHEEGLAGGLQWLTRWMPRRHGLNVELTGTEHIPVVTEDLTHLLFESIRELLLNVTQHAGVDVVRVDVRPGRGREIRFTVSDEGCGFDPAVVKPQDPEATGFGLFAISERVELVGGMLLLDSREGAGSRITIIVPIERARPPVDPPVAAPKDVERRGVALARREPKLPAARVRVLIADDHPVMREGLSLLLSRHADIEVVAQAVNGQHAIELTRLHHPEVVLMDVSMPVLNGIEAARVILRESPQVKIIGLSLHEDPDRARTMLSAGAVRYLSKSRASDDLVAAIRDSVIVH